MKNRKKIITLKRIKWISEDEKYSIQKKKKKTGYTWQQIQQCREKRSLNWRCENRKQKKKWRTEHQVPARISKAV